MSNDGGSVDGASRSDYASMVRLALGLYGDGLSRQEVLRSCYGVDFPEEFFAVVDAGPELLDWGVDTTDLPWQLAIPPDQGGPADRPYSTRLERELLDLDEDLLPLARLIGLHTRYGGRVACYRLSDLAAGHGAVAVVHPDRQAEVTAHEGSFLEVVHRHYANLLEQMRRDEDDPANARIPMVEPGDIEEAEEHLRQVEALMERLGQQRS